MSAFHPLQTLPVTRYALPMRRLHLFLVGLAAVTASCEEPKQLADGCYYAGAEPVFKIVGSQGRVLIPGDVRAFKVERLSSTNVRFIPGLLFDGAGADPSFVRADPANAPPYHVKAGSTVPTIQMHWAAYGDQDVRLGKSC
jgi:hypothetical protein